MTTKPSDPYEELGISSTASTEEIKAAYRELVKLHHPDAGGDARVFERLQKMRDSVLAQMN